MPASPRSRFIPHPCSPAQRAHNDAVIHSLVGRMPWEPTSADHFKVLRWNNTDKRFEMVSPCTAISGCSTDTGAAGDCDCTSGTLGSVYRITVPANTFVGNCAAFFNGATFDVGEDGFFSSTCCRSVDLSGLGCDEEGFGSAATACFMMGGIAISFTSTLGGGVNFLWTNTSGVAFDCSTTRTADFNNNTVADGGFTSEAGKTVSIELIP